MKVHSFSPAILLCVAALILSVTGCGDEKSHVKKPGETVVARVGDEEITSAVLDRALAGIPEGMRERHRDKVLDHMIEVRVFAEEARKAGLDKDPQIKEALAKAEDEILARSFVNKHIDQQAAPSEEELKKFYVAHKDQFVVPESVLIQRILVKKRAEAEEVLKALKEGAGFEALAKEKSVAPSSARGAPHEWLYRGRTDPVLEQMAFRLEKEKLSDVIETREGFQLIKVLDRRGEREIPFEEAKPKIHARLFSEKKKALIDTYFKEAGVNTHPGEQGVLAKVGGESFTEEDLALVLGKASEREKAKLKHGWLRRFIETTVFSREARKVRLEDDPQVADELRTRTDEILASAFRQRLIGGEFQIGDQEIEDYYRSHIEDFTLPLRLRVKSVLVGTREEAEDILKELEAGASFDVLAAKKSLHPEASRRGGGISWFGQGEKDPALEEVAFSLEKGQISGVIETEAGFEIIELMDKKGGQVRPLDEVKPAIKMTLISQRLDKEKQHYYKKARVVLSHLSHDG